MMTMTKNKQGESRCEACQGRGWLLAFNTDRRVYEIQRCDACDRYASDEKAGDAAAPLIHASIAIADLAVQNALAVTRRQPKKD
jgi:hypothetical protein